MDLYGSALLEMYVEFEPTAKAVTRLRENVCRISTCICYQPQGEPTNRFEKKTTFGSLNNIGYFLANELVYHIFYRNQPKEDHEGYQ